MILSSYITTLRKAVENLSIMNTLVKILSPRSHRVTNCKWTPYKNRMELESNRRSPLKVHLKINISRIKNKYIKDWYLPKLIQNTYILLNF